MAELEELMRSGIIGFADGRAISNLGLLRRVLEYLKPSGIPLALFSLNPSLRGRGVMREGQASIRYGLPGDPLYSESIAVAASIELVASVGTPIHLMRISTRRSLELIADARQRGFPVTASTTWLHLLFDTEAIASYDPNLRLDPPLGNPDDRLALIEGVKSGTIGAIAIDHTPYSYEEKTLAFAEAPAGAIGLQLALPILWDKFARSGKWTALQLWQAMSLKPRRYLNQSPMALSAENNRDFILFDPDRVWTVSSESIESLSQNTVYWGKTLRGKVLRVGVWELAELTKRSQ
jgi:dihydroorotase